MTIQVILLMNVSYFHAKEIRLNLCWIWSKTDSTELHVYDSLTAVIQHGGKEKHELISMHFHVQFISSKEGLHVLH